MNKKFLPLLAIAAVISLFNSCNPKDNQKVTATLATGLLPEDPGKISRIPPADIPFGGAEIPESVDMSDKMPEVGNQGTQESCVAWAMAYALKGYQENVQLGTKLKFSPSFVYNQINGGRNVPTNVTDGLNILSNEGVCLMEEMPYSNDSYEEKPSTEAKASAKRFKIDEWRRVNTFDIQEVKTHLASGVPVIIGAQITKAFQEDGFAKGADYVWTSYNEKDKIGGHALLVVGYDDAKNAFKVINSWGKNWGDGGYGWIDYKVFPEAVMYGFVAKDGYTAPEAVADIKAHKQPEADPTEKDNPNQPETTRNNPKENNNKTDNPTTDDAAIDFHQSNVLYDVKSPDRKHPGLAMKVEGTLDIPARYGKNFYVLVTVYNKATNKPVKTTIYPEYSNINHELAAYTDPILLDDERMKAKWWVHIPYDAFDLHGKRTDLYAVPTLFIDNFGVKNGEQIDFWFE